MKKKIKNLTATLTYDLEAMYDAEKKIQKKLPAVIAELTPGALKKTLQQYVETAADRRTKLKRMFSYLLSGPFGRKSRVTEKLFGELEDICQLSAPQLNRDLLIVSAFSSLVHYKCSAYQVAAEMALHVDLEPVAEMLEEIIRWENDAIRSLKKVRTAKINLLQKESLTAAL